MKKILAILFATLLIFSVGCASKPEVIANTPLPATPAPVATPVPTPEVTLAPTEVPAEQNANPDLAPILTMTRQQVTDQYGAGTPVPYGDISDYTETGYALYGFPCEYSNLGGVMVFYDGAAPAEDASPYYCTEDPNDKVLGIMLPPSAVEFNVNGALCVLDADSLDALDKTFGAKIEHVNGMYEYYEVVVTDGNVQYVWRSDSENMADATLYAGPPQEE